MVVNTNLSAESAAAILLRNQSAPAKPSARSDSTASPAPAPGTLAETAPVVSTQNLTAPNNPILDLDAAQKSADSARASMLAQPRATFLAQANLSPATVLKLLQ
jgi:flagellin-like hook-associated protein FlgL